MINTIHSYLYVYLAFILSIVESGVKHHNVLGYTTGMFESSIAIYSDVQYINSYGYCVIREKEVNGTHRHVIEEMTLI